LEKPLPRFIEDMGGSGGPELFVDVEHPGGEYTHPQDTVSFFPAGLTEEGYYFSGTTDVQGDESDANDHHILLGKYAGESILLNEIGPLRGGLDDLQLVLAIRIKLFLEFQIVKADSISFGSSEHTWWRKSGDNRYHDSDE
jgi:hypothetical protein